MRFFSRTILLSNPNGEKKDFIPVCGSFSKEFTVPQRDFPVTSVIRFAGEPDYFWKWRRESGSPYSMSQTLDDALDSRDTFREAFSLAFDCHNEPYDKEAWMKIKEDFLPGKEYTFSFPCKRENLSYADGGTVRVELEIYRQKEGRHPWDVFDASDELLYLEVPQGTGSWQLLEKRFTMPQDAVCMIVHVLLRGVSGKVLLGSPKLVTEGKDNIIPPFERMQHRDREYCYTAAHISRREWIEFACFIDGKKIFDGEKYTSIFRRPDFELDAGVLTAGKHTVTFQFKNDYPAAVGFVMQQLELLEYGHHDFEIIWAPEYITEKTPLRLLLKTAKDDVAVTVAGTVTVFPKAGLNVLHLAALPCGQHEIQIDSPGHADSVKIDVIPRYEDAEKLCLSTGDAIFIRQTPEEMLNYLEWYLENHIGNAVCFRHSHRWGGGRQMDPAIWQAVIPLLNELGIYYSLMVDGRELPGRNFNPPDSLIDGPYYLGRQAHENDGAFYYWNNTLWKPEPFPEPMGDILSRSVNPGGIHPAVRPKRKGIDTWWFFDPTDCSDMKEASAALVANFKDAQGASTRHSGPSTLFRYFFQAGYKFLVAEQMYGPEEVILSSLRGASKAYGADGFGAHLAVQWGSKPHDTPEHAERYFLSLASCYMQGVTQINTEEGLYRMESGFVDYDRFSRNCERHREAHTRFRRFMESTPRRGKMVTPVACIQGRYDGWCCFVRNNVWFRQGDPWQFGDAEKSFDLLKVFFPRSRFEAIAHSNCPVAPQGWYTGTPYGPVDLTPFEADWSSYRCVIFLGWHSFEKGDGEKMLSYVKNGGTLLLSRRHLSVNLVHNGAPEYVADSALDELLGKNWQSASGIIRRQTGRGKVIFFASDSFPAEESIRAEYSAAMKEAAEEVCALESEKCYVKANEDVNFSVRELPDGSRQVLLLNIRWWDKKSASVTLCRNGITETVEVPEGVIIVK